MWKASEVDVPDFAEAIAVESLPGSPFLADLIGGRA